LLVFRTLRFFWQRDVDAQPLLAALRAYSRDPILRATAPFVLDFQEGATVTREGMEEFIDAQEPGRFSKATLKSTVALGGTNANQFRFTNGCGTPLAAKAKCVIKVAFKPTTKGAKVASLNVNGGGGGLRSVSLTGTGVL
jgi:hypothetical protein